MQQIHSPIRTAEPKIIQAIEIQNRLVAEGWQWRSVGDLIAVGTGYGIKRGMDFCFAALFMAIFAPLYVAIAIAVKLDSPGPVFFRETRMGLHQKKFKIWKFRSMQADAEKRQVDLEALNELTDGVNFKIKNDPRITRIGGFLRRNSLDELPQMINVLCGEMSLVGPRPFNLRDTGNLAPHHFFRCEVLPGITGLWQVSGRSNILNFERAMQLDISYIENWSLWLDFQILLKTVKVVIKKEGAY